METQGERWCLNIRLKPYIEPILMFKLVHLAIALGALCSTSHLLGQTVFVKTAMNHDDSGNQAATQQDKLYHDLLRSLDRLQAVWQQQPNNLVALQNVLAELHNTVTLFCPLFAQTSTETPGFSPVPEMDNGVIGKAQTKGPSGPVQPSQKPSSADERQRQLEATMARPGSTGRFEDDGLASKTLQGVPSVWIHQQCLLAENEITKIHRNLSTATIDKDTLMKSFKQLRSILHRMDSPP